MISPFIFASCIMKVYLIGYMASGKTNIGRDLAALMGCPFADLDDLFEERYRLSIPDCFGKYGEGVFRQLEQKVLRDTVNLEQAVISTGGGTPCHYDNMEFIRNSGTSVYLKLTVPELLVRLKKIRKKRPVLEGISASGLEEFVTRQLSEREHYYLQADLVVDGGTCDAGCIFGKLFPDGLR